LLVNYGFPYSKSCIYYYSAFGDRMSSCLIQSPEAQPVLPLKAKKRAKVLLFSELTKFSGKKIPKNVILLA